MFDIQLGLILMVLRFKILLSGCSFGKHELIIVRKLAPIRVFTLLQYGGLYHIICLPLFLGLLQSLDGEYVNLQLYPDLFSASS